MARRLFYPNITFYNGELHRVFGDSAIHIRAWPEPAAKRFGRGIPVASVQPSLWVGLKFGQPDQPLNQQREVLKQLERDPSPWVRFCNTVPNEIRSALDGCVENHFSLLCLIARHPGALDMLRSNPAIAVILNRRLAFRGTADSGMADSAENLLKRKRRDILQYFGFPGTRSAASVLRKVTSAAATVEALLILRTIMLNDARMRLLRRLPHVSRSVIAVMSDPDLLERVSPSFLMELAQPESEGPFDSVEPERIAMTISSIGEAHSLLRPRQRPVMFRSSAHLCRVRDELFRASRQLVQAE